ncbi:unnamed protein product [Diabrotica balteata]|uniref:CRAL-TRIO domain-containing protein n=1 Tax=Diabrotica balteata TaxID=107213 RepID=A0A9N9T1C5_DIABA|nr:unnamed protein product [Diabrotica balteata]
MSRSVNLTSSTMTSIIEEKKVKKLKELVKIATENKVNRLDERFLKRFLVGRQYDTIAALRAIQNFESFVDRHRNKWLKLKKSRIELILNCQIVEILENTGLQGQHIVWIRLENWDPQLITADEILEISGMLCELLYSKTDEVKYIDIIMDLHNFSLKHMYGLSPKFARRMVFFISECLPVNLLHVYVIRQPKLFYVVFSLFKPFLEESMRNSIRICGNNYDLLKVTIGKDNLPPQLEGTSDKLNPNKWLNLFYDKNTQKDLKLSGYEFY